MNETQQQKQEAKLSLR